MRRCLPVVWLFLAYGCGHAPQNVDLVLKNAFVYTLNPQQPEAQAVAIDGGRIVAVGADTDVATRYRGTSELDLGGEMVLPGFIDSHVHPVQGGVESMRCALNDIATIEAILAKVADCNAAAPGNGWLLGSGWNLGLFKDANPSKKLLDDIAADRPILRGKTATRRGRIRAHSSSLTSMRTRPIRRTVSSNEIRRRARRRERCGRVPRVSSRQSCPRFRMRSARRVSSARWPWRTVSASRR
jgi:hypothetical protein